jgi:hypothetical protein
VKVKDFFHHNPMPSRVEIINDDNEQVPIRRSTATTSTSNRNIAPIGVNIAANASNKINTAAAAAITAITATASATTGLNATIAGNPPKEFYDQLIATIKNLQQAAPLHQQKIVVESRKHNESINLAKLQMSMLKLMYACSNINWEEGAVKNIHLATFVQGFKNLPNRLQRSR